VNCMHLLGFVLKVTPNIPAGRPAVPRRAKTTEELFSDPFTSEELWLLGEGTLSAKDAVRIAKAAQASGNETAGGTACGSIMVMFLYS